MKDNINMNALIRKTMSAEDMEKYAQKLLLCKDYDQYAMALYGKHQEELDKEERLLWAEYCMDIELPEWRKVKCDYLDRVVEVNQTGTEVKDPVSGRLYKIYMPDDGQNYNYPTIYVRNDTRNGTYMQTVHRLVARAFCPNDDPENRTQVNHINGIKSCNWYKNLEWVTPSENIQHALQTGLVRPLRGEETGRATCTDNQVRKACELMKNHPEMPYSKISELTGVPRNSLSSISQGVIWTHISKEYQPFPERTAKLRGEDVGNSVYSEETIRQVCEFLQDRPDMKYSEITELTGVKSPMISAIYHGDNWTHVSKDYEFAPRKTQLSGEGIGDSKYKTDQIEKVCSLLDDRYAGRIKMSFKEIADLCGVSRDVVKDIHRGKTWKNIASKHPFYKRKFG